MIALVHNNHGTVTEDKYKRQEKEQRGEEGRYEEERGSPPWSPRGVKPVGRA